MSITTLDGVLAGTNQPYYFVKASKQAQVSGLPISYWGVAGIPGPGSFNTTLNGGTYSSSSGLVAGQLAHFDPPGGQNCYLLRCGVENNGQSTGSILLCDRIWDNGGITITSTAAQNIVSPAWPARDSNGATSGVGIYLAVEVSAVTGAGTPTLTVSYTNSAGTAGRSATNVTAGDATRATSQVGDFYRIGLAAGDIGVQSVQSLTLSATWTSGTINLVAYRPYAMVDLPGNEPGEIDPITGGFPRLFNGTVPFIVAIMDLQSTPFNLSGLYCECSG